MKFTGKTFNDNGELVSVELKAPPTFQTWKCCFSVFRNAMVMLGAIDPGNLLDDEKFFDYFYSRCGDLAWALMHQCDVRTRTEKIPRARQDAYQEFLEVTRRNGGATPDGHPFDQDRPWDFVYKPIFDEKHNNWWYKGLEYNAIMLVSITAGLRDVVERDATIMPGVPSLTPPGLPEHATPYTDTSGQGLATDRATRRKRTPRNQHNLNRAHFR